MDWLHLPSRHRITRESALDAGRESDLQGLVLLDLPDFDSTRSATATRSSGCWRWSTSSSG